MKHPTLLLVALALTVSGCRAATTTDSMSSSSSSIARSSAAPAVNVSFEGVVRDGDASIYMQGTHRLELESGGMVLLESNDLNLSRYVGKRVAILGLSQPSVEGSGIIVQVREITVLTGDDESSSSEEMSSEALSSASSEPASSSVAALSSSSKAVVSSKSSIGHSSSSLAAISSAQASSQAAVIPSDTDDAATVTAEAMAKSNMADANWTQQYCTSHIGFCFPVHKNWWFKSFGTTSSHLWHVEIGNAEIDELGQGPLVVNLSSGTAESEGAADGEVRTQGAFVVGYKNWTENRHIQVSAPAVLQPAVRYILGHITASSVQ